MSTKSKRRLRKVMKMLVFLICTAGFFYHTWTFLELYLAYPTLQDANEEYPESFALPAITICNRNRLPRQSFCETYPEKCTWNHTTWETFCEMYRKQCPKIKIEYFSFGIPKYRQLHTRKDVTKIFNAVEPHEEEDFIIECKHTGPTLNRTCNSSISIQVPKDGYPYNCFSLFSLLGKQYEESLKVTSVDGIAIYLDLQPEDYFNPSDAVQASVVLHDPRKLANPMTEGVTLSAGKMYRLYPTMEIRKSLPAPYDSNCMDYLKEWKKNGGHGPLSKHDCIELCKMKAMIDEQGCVKQSVTYPNNYTICGRIAFGASTEVTRKCSSSCQDACDENIYHLTSEQASDIQASCHPTDEHCKNTYLYIYVNFDRMMFQKFQQIPRFESIELFSYVGGYLGMWLGISLASLFDFAEMIYNITEYLFRRGRRKRKVTTPTEQIRLPTVQKKNRNRKNTKMVSLKCIM